MRHWERPENWVPHKLAAVIGEDGQKILVQIPGFNAHQIPQLRPILQSYFDRTKSLPTNVDTIPDEKRHFVCATEGCNCEEFHVRKASGNGNSYSNDAHFRSRSVHDHIDSCVFKNPAVESHHRVSVADAVKSNLNILINLDADFGYYTDTPLKGLSEEERQVIEDVSEYGITRKFMMQSGGYITEPVHSMADVIGVIEKIQDVGLSIGDDDVINLARFNHKGRILRYDDFRMEDVSNSSFPRRDEQLDALVRELIQDSADKNYNRDGQVAARMRDFYAPHPHKVTYNTGDRTVTLDPVEVSVNGFHYLLSHRLRFDYLAGEQDQNAARVMHDQMRKMGRHFVCLAAASIDREHAPFALDHAHARTPRGAPLSTIYINWVIKDPAIQMRAVEKPVDLSVVASSRFVPGIYKPEDDARLKLAAAQDGLRIPVRRGKKRGLKNVPPQFI